jgi:GNAT superfamily N-acetyltransferase
VHPREAIATRDEQQPTKLVIASHFPDPPTVGTAGEGHDGWRLSRQWGGYPELEWTFSIFAERIRALGGRLPAYFYEDVTDFEIARWLVRVGTILVSRGEPSYPSVGLGFEYLDSAYRVPDGRLVCDGTPYRGRHSVAAVDHTDMEEIKFINSWDPPSWGDGGFGYVSREYFEQHVDDVHARWSATGGPSIVFGRCMERAEKLSFPREERLMKCWSTRNVFWKQEVATADQQLAMLNWTVYSIATGVLVDVIEIRDENEVVGRVHLYHDEVATLRELFVRPERRREGIGSILEGTAAEWARDYGHAAIQIWLREADARERVIGAPIAFAASRGYIWEDIKMRRPNVVKIAHRTL